MPDNHRTGIILISKLLIIVSSLVVVQIALLLMWTIKLDSFEDRMDVLTESTGQIQNSEAVVMTPPPDESVAAQTGLDSQQLRRIIRQELQAALNGSELAARNSATDPQEPVFDDVEMQYQQDLIIEELDILKEQDEVSSMELDNLLGAIARLDPERRTEMFKMLNRAINRGEIKGHL